MARGHGGVVGAGARLVWRRQRVLWWVYAINLVLALLGTLPAAFRIGSVLNASLAAERLRTGFDVALFAELAAHPDVSLGAQVPGSFFFVLLFFVFILFVTGGILEVYRRDLPLAAGEFFQACGAFFWRWVRLLIFLLIVLVPILILDRVLNRWSGRLASDSPREMLGFWVQVAGLGVVLFLLMAVRLWFDMAQVRAVAENERVMRRTLVSAFKLTLGSFGQLFWMYLRISLLAWAGLAAAIWVWVKFVPPERVGISFLLSQAVVLLWLGTRLWQRASETLWYQRRYPAPAPAPKESAPTTVTATA